MPSDEGGMIEAIHGKVGVPRARAVCDDCGREEVATCDYEHKAGHQWVPNEGQMIRKMTGQGWAMVKGKLRCPGCEAKRKMNTKPEVELKPESTVTPLRQPTREQKRQIMSLLEVAYDTDAGRYKGTDTDNTIAETIGAGVMPGWVAEVREEFFGPDGGNGEMDALLAEMRAWVKARETERHNAKVHLETAESILRTVDDKIVEVAGFAKRVEAIQKAVGPKAARA